MANAFDVLRERGFVYQCSDEAALRKRLDEGPVSVYCGFDPTASSLHIGNLVQVMALAHFQRNGNRPISVVGGGTAMIGDPTDKTSSRRLMPTSEIDTNARVFRRQLSSFLDFSESHDAPEGRAIMVDNAEWLRALNYLEFLRDYGRYFSVNDMLRMETYRSRLETGLSFLEFNYALLQGYDFLELFRRYGCTLQIGGSDQWANMLAGTDLIRKCEGAESFVVTHHLITDSSGAKMGKSSASGQIWLDAELTSPYDYYQFWLNVDDADVERMLAIFTFVPMDEVRQLAAADGAALRGAKERLAFEATKLAHGEEAARKAESDSRGAFARGDVEQRADALIAAGEVVEIPRATLDAGISSPDLLVAAGLAASKGEARRLISQGGAYLNEARLDIRDVTAADLVGNAMIVSAGKKRHKTIVAV